MTTTTTETEPSYEIPVVPELPTEAEHRLQAVISAGNALRGLPAEAGDVVLTADYIIHGTHPAIVPAPSTSGTQILDGGDADTV